jgi:hypothetical protein
MPHKPVSGFFLGNLKRLFRPRGNPAPQPKSGCVLSTGYAVTSRNTLCYGAQRLV